MVRLHLIAEFKNTDSPEDARRQLDAFREAAQPSREYEITLYENSAQTATTEGDSSEPGHPNNPRSNYDTE